jgi:hypothetical protein
MGVSFSLQKLKNISPEAGIHSHTKFKLLTLDYSRLTNQPMDLASGFHSPGSGFLLFFVVTCN